MQNATEIESIRADLAAWSERQPKAVQNAVRNLDGWLASLVNYEPSMIEAPGVNILACTARAVETLRGSLRDCPAAR